LLSHKNAKKILLLVSFIYLKGLQGLRLTYMITICTTIILPGIMPFVWTCDTIL